MLEIQVLSWFIGSLGLQALVASGWWRWQTIVVERQREEEEELLTPYESKDSDISTEAIEPMRSGHPSAQSSRSSGWEFKIVRANRDLFRDPKIFAQLCHEEAEAGWILLEKLDDRRVRFKRPIALRDLLKTHHLSHDAYRTFYGPTFSWMTVGGAIALLTAILLPAYLGYTLVSLTLGNLRGRPVPLLPEPSPSPSLTVPSSPTPEAAPPSETVPPTPTPPG